MAGAAVSANIGDAPQAGQTVSHNGKEYNTIKEGLAYILVPNGAPSSTDPKKAKSNGPQAQSVFYNPIQQFNRDLSVLAIRAYGEAMAVEKRQKHSRASQKKKQGGKKKGDENGSKNSPICNGGAAEQGTTTNGRGALGIEKVGKTVGVGDPDIPKEEPARAYQNGNAETVEASCGEKRKRDTEEAEFGPSTKRSKQLGPDAVNNDSATTQPDQNGNAELVEARCGEKRKRDVEEAGPKPDIKRSKQSKAGAIDDTHATSQPDVEGRQSTTIINSTDADQFPSARCQTLADLTSGATNSETNNAVDGANSNEWRPSFSILDALSATGLRALRYAQEIPFVTLVTANDLLPTATASIKLNVQHNHLEGKIVPITGNALAHMYSVLDGSSLPRPAQQGLRGKYDVIDLDPYGSAAPFLDAAVQALNNGGLLCVTCTDAGVFASSGYPEKTYALYGGLPIKGPQSHEGGLRLILHAISTSAARYGIAIEPLLSLSIDFYARLFVRARKSAAEVKFLAGKTMVVYNCDQGCGAWSTQLLARNREEKDKVGGTFSKHGLAQAPSAGERCEHCGFKTHLAGPMYAGPLHSPSFIQRILDLLPQLDKETYTTTSRIEGMLVTALEETLTPRMPPSVGEMDQVQAASLHSSPAEVDHYPFFFIPHALSKVLHCQTPSENALRGAFKHLGYRVTRSHTKPGSIRTDAPWRVIWEVMREWSRQKSSVDPEAIKEGTAGWGIMRRAFKMIEPEKVQDGLRAPKDTSTTQNQTPAAEGSENHTSACTSCNPGKLKVIFDEKLGKQADAKKLVRYQLNPRANWGPMNRAKGGQTD
ncbi:MAG: RNA methyltransferase tRNA(m5U54)methyltransferase [Candelina submexicana]|nr:MAG: RNA methyltransferase tRNA(m5U54)methyltransferase [Candelina submexicana]